LKKGKASRVVKRRKKRKEKTLMQKGVPRKWGSGRTSYEGERKKTSVWEMERDLTRGKVRELILLGGGGCLQIGDGAGGNGGGGGLWLAQKNGVGGRGDYLFWLEKKKNPRAKRSRGRVLNGVSREKGSREVRSKRALPRKGNKIPCLTGDKRVDGNASTAKSNVPLRYNQKTGVKSREARKN